MKYSSFRNIFLVLISLMLTTTGCFKDLDTTPLDEDIQISSVVYNAPGAYKQVLAKLYASFAVTGQEGPAGQGDISGIDEGFGSYLRMYWYHQELPTDEAVIGWNDATIKDFHNQSWNAQDGFIFAMYSRIFYTISVCNEFLRETTEEKVDGRGQASIKGEVATYRAEARFLRALAYYHALDLFRNVPFVTENDEVGSFFPQQIQAVDLFDWLEQEILDLSGQLAAANSNEYGRADQAAAWMLLAKLYLNAEVYIGEDRYSDAAEYSRRVIETGYQLEDVYGHNFLADNETSSEIIFPINFDGDRTQTYGGMTFVINASIGGDMDPAASGVQGGWGGTRTTSALVAKFPEVGGTLVEPVFDSGNYPLLNVPGAYQGWDPENDANAMASINDDGNYEGYFYFAEGGEFKFALGSWDTNWGDTGADGTLEPGGDNLSVTDPGFYRITVDTANLTYSVLKTEWGLIGDATPGGWDNDTDMTYNPESGAWELTVELTKGEIKFRANDDWGINLGDTNGNAILEQDGSNISIPSAGTYTIKLYLDKPDYTYALISTVDDKRKFFFTEGQTLEIEDISQFQEGYAITKFKNIRRDGSAGSNGNFPDTDYPVFRLADAYLMHAEAIMRSSGVNDEALSSVNAVRIRAGAGAITESDLTLDFLLDERARELYWEGHRRTDLVRFGQLTDGSYIWPWKGGIPEGTSTPGYRDVFPIPSSDIGANPNLSQNPGY